MLSSASACTTPPRASASSGRSPPSDERPSWGFLLLVGLIGGGPTFFGTAARPDVGQRALSVAFLALAAGSILYVVIELFDVCRRAGRSARRLGAHPRPHARLRDGLRARRRRRLTPCSRRRLGGRPRVAAGMISVGGVEQAGDSSRPTTAALVVTGGIAPCSTRRARSGPSAVPERDRGEGRARSDQRLEPVDLHKRVRRRRPEVEDDVHDVQ